uniref:Uncharacterized protein n=1 Tax=mine drainage metagenome TaxID=410659 RepID=E6Q3V6_9ZZZZ
MLALATACGGASGVVLPPQPVLRGMGVVDTSTQPCVVSYDGIISYSVPSGSFSPIDIRSERCAAASLNADSVPPIPAWAKPTGPTQAVFIATSLQEAYSVPGMESIEADASASHVPVTWMIGNAEYLRNANLYNQYHQDNGDDVQIEEGITAAQVQAVIPWYRPAVSIEGGGHERNISGAIARGDSGFWGIAWDSQGIDGNRDLGAPWGTYCADIASYKRPAPDGSCAMLAFEWTARDLTRAYLSTHSDFFSTDPDDIQQRAGFTATAGSTYEREIADAYAAAGQTQGLVMMSQQESAENLNPGDATVLGALYAEAVADGMHAETLSQAVSSVRAFSALPRAVAFPYIPGGINVPSPIISDGTLYPATIDYHDTIDGMTFLAGHTMPTRVFRYADDPLSYYNVPLALLSASRMPTLIAATVKTGSIVFEFQSPIALHFGVAIWSDPTALGIVGPGVTPAGRAGVVLTFNLQPGRNDVTFACPGCISTTFPYAT